MFMRSKKLPSRVTTPPRVLGIDVLYIAHGSLETVSSRDFLEDLHKKSKDRQIHILSEAELDKR
jgi:hypothetical protein